MKKSKNLVNERIREAFSFPSIKLRKHLKFILNFQILANHFGSSASFIEWFNKRFIDDYSFVEIAYLNSDDTRLDLRFDFDEVTDAERQLEVWYLNLSESLGEIYSGLTRNENLDSKKRKQIGMAKNTMRFYSDVELQLDSKILGEYVKELDPSKKDLVGSGAGLGAAGDWKFGNVEKGCYFFHLTPNKWNSPSRKTNSHGLNVVPFHSDMASITIPMVSMIKGFFYHIIGWEKVLNGDKEIHVPILSTFKFQIDEAKPPTILKSISQSIKDARVYFNDSELILTTSEKENIHREFINKFFKIVCGPVYDKARYTPSQHFFDTMIRGTFGIEFTPLYNPNHNTRKPVKYQFSGSTHTVEEGMAAKKKGEKREKKRKPLPKDLQSEEEKLNGEDHVF